MSYSWVRARTMQHLYCGYSFAAVSVSISNPHAPKITTALNAHAGLVEALTELSGWVERVHMPSYSKRKPAPENLTIALKKASAALAKVQS